MPRISFAIVVCLAFAGCVPAKSCGDSKGCGPPTETQAELAHPQPKTPAQLLALYSGDAVHFPLAPHYECVEAEGSQAFLTELARIAVEEDLAALKALAADDMAYYIQNHQFNWGRDDFFEILDATNGTQTFANLLEILPLGCAVQDDSTIMVPWYLSTPLPPQSRFGHALVIGRDVPLFSLLDSERTGERPRAASWEWAELTNGSYSRFETMQFVRLTDGTEGLIAPQRMYSSAGKRLIAERRNGRWVITAWINILEPTGVAP